MALTYGLQYGIDVLEIPSVPSISQAVNFGGNNIKFTIDQSENDCYIGKNCYGSIALQITQLDGSGLPHPLCPFQNAGGSLSVPYLNNNPAMCLFETIRTLLRGQEVASYNYAGSVNTIYRTMFESKPEQDSVYSTNAINPLSLKDCVTTGGVLYDDYIAVAQKMSTATGTTVTSGTIELQFTKHGIWALKNNQFGFDTYTTNRINFQIPSELFMCDELLYFGVDAKCELIFGTYSNWLQNLIGIAGSTVPAGQTNPYVLTNTQTPTKPYSINVLVTDFKLYMCRGHLTNVNVPRSLTCTYYMKKFSVFTSQILNSGGNIVGNLKSGNRMTHIAIGFFINPNNTFKSSPTDLSCGFSSFDSGTGATFIESKNSTDAISLIKKISINFGGFTYPQESLTLNTDSSMNNNQLLKAYYDTIVACDGLRSQSGFLMSASQWIVNQLYVFKLKTTKNNTSGNISIECDLTSSIPSTMNCNLICVGLYDEYLTLKFDEYARMNFLKLHADMIKNPTTGEIIYTDTIQ